MALSAPSILAPEPAGAKQDARATRSVLMISIDDEGEAILCASPLQGFGNVEPRQATVNLGASVSQKKIRQILRDLRWRNQRGNPCYVVVPSEHVLLLVEEFPTTDKEEARIMAEGLVQGLVELDPAEHVMLMQDLHRGTSNMMCALAIFERRRLQQIFEWVHKLGVSEPRFVLDVLALWQVSGHAAPDEYWGRVVRDEASSRVIVKGLKIQGGVLRAACQRYYHRNEVNEAWVATLGPELFPDDFKEGQSPGITWYLSGRGHDSPAHMANLCRTSATAGLIHFEPPSGFWSGYLYRQRRRRFIRAITTAAVSGYLFLVASLVVLGIFQWNEIHQLQQIQEQQGPAYRDAVQLNRELTMLRESLNPSGNALEMLRQLAEAMPETLTLDSFSYRFQENLKLRGTATQSEAVYDLVGKLRDNPAFKNAKVDSVGENSAGGGVNWQVTVSLQTAPTL